MRVSTFDQNENRQLEGVQIDRVFLDKASGKHVCSHKNNAGVLRYAQDDDEKLEAMITPAGKWV